MRKRIGFSLVLALIVSGIFLYSQNQSGNGLLSPKNRPVPEYSDPSGAIETAVGQSFVITLESNRTTGYGWEISPSPDAALLKVEEIQHRASPAKGLVGAPGTDSWTFKALNPGQTTIALKYVRPWEKDVAPAKEAVFSVTIKP